MEVIIADKTRACSTLLLSGMWMHSGSFDSFVKILKDTLDDAVLHDHNGEKHKVNKFSFLLASTNTAHREIIKFFRDLGFTEIPATWNAKNGSYAILFIIPVHELLPKINSTLEPIYKEYKS